MDTQSVYQIERSDTLAHLDALEKDWTDLIDEIPGVPIFLTWVWIRTWWLYFGQGRQLWLLTARDKQGRLVGLAPFMMEVYTIGLLKLRIIAFIGTGPVIPIHLNILSRSPDQTGLFQAFLDFLMAQSDQWDVLSLASVARDSTVYQQLSAAGGRIRTGAQTLSPYIPLPGSWETYIKTVSKKLRRNLKYFRAKLESDYPGTVAFACISDIQELSISMNRLEEFSRNRWHAKKLSTVYDDPTYSSFHHAIACLALNRDWLRLYTLTANGQIIALFYCFRLKDRVYAYQIGFDIDWSGYSPGRLLIAHGIQAAIQEGASVLDWGPGNHDYKLAWTDQICMEDEILLSSNWKGNLWIKRENLVGELKIKARQVLPQSTQIRIKQFLSARRKKDVDRSDNNTE
jgi:CelD/BcsL family acetyltransferase involved in cellulose biosynthesis